MSLTAATNGTRLAFDIARRLNLTVSARLTHIERGAFDPTLGRAQESPTVLDLQVIPNRREIMKEDGHDVSTLIVYARTTTLTIPITIDDTLLILGDTWHVMRVVPDLYTLTTEIHLRLP